MKGHLKSIVFISTLFFLVNLAYAAGNPPPLRTVKTTTSRMLAALKRHKGSLRNRRVIRRIVRQIVVPKMDVTSIARSVVGRYHWRRASSQAKRRFVALFTNYVIRMYSSALSSYSNEKILFRPLRGFSSASRRVQVYSLISRPGRSRIHLNYRLVRRKSGWKIYDFSVDGVSMVNSYHAQFADTLARTGLNGLTKKLQARKRR